MSMTTTHSTLWNRDFFLYWLGLAGTALGDAFIFVALPFLVLGVSEAPGTLATAVALGSLPRFLGPVIGSVTDRLRLKVPLIAVGLVRAVLFVGLGLWAIAGGSGLGLLYGAAFLNGLLTVFVFSAGNVVLPRLVPDDQLGRANSLLQAAVMGLPLLGYGVAGVLIAALGPGLTAVSSAPLFLVLAAVAPFIRFPNVIRPERTHLLSDLGRGARYVFSRVTLASVLVLTCTLNVALATLSVAMPLAMEASKRGAAGYGVFQSVLSVGTLVGILAVSLISSRLSAPVKVGLANALTAVGFALFALGEFAWFLGGAVVVGFGLGMTEVAAVTLLQLAVPDGMRGKVMGLVLAANALGLTLGAWLVGLLAGPIGLSGIYLTLAVLLLAATGLWVRVNAKQPGSFKPIV